MLMVLSHQVTPRSWRTQKMARMEGTARSATQHSETPRQHSAEAGPGLELQSCTGPGKGEVRLWLHCKTCPAGSRESQSLIFSVHQLAGRGPRGTEVRCIPFGANSRMAGGYWGPVLLYPSISVLEAPQIKVPEVTMALHSLEHN